MGSRSKINLAYVADFLDGDGSLMFQIKKRKDGALKNALWLPYAFIKIRDMKENCIGFSRGSVSAAFQEEMTA